MARFPVRLRRFFMTEPADPLRLLGLFIPRQLAVLVIPATKKMAESAKTPPFLLEHLS
jgi:hypothetical protein